MEAAVKKAIELLAGRITESVDSADAMRFTQAALNLSHVLATFDNMKAKP